MPLQDHAWSLCLNFECFSSVFNIKDVNYSSLRSNCKIFSIVTKRNFSCWTVTLVWVRSLTNEFWKIVYLNQRIVWGKSHFTIIRWKCKVVDSGAVTLNYSLWNGLKILSIQENDSPCWVSNIRQKFTLLLHKGTKNWFDPIRFHRPQFDWWFWGWKLTRAWIGFWNP